MENEDAMIVAMDWVEKMNTSADAEQLRPALDAWLSSSPAHRLAYEEAETRWSICCRLIAALQQGDQVQPDAFFKEIDDAARRSRWHRYLRRQRKRFVPVLAVSSACALVAFALQLPRPASDTAASVLYRSGYGMPKPYVLSDGTRLYLNDNSEVRVRMTPVVREVTLDRGELLVQVTHDVKRGFRVNADHVVLRAIGTAFAVRRDEDGGVEVVVEEGTVTVKSAATSFVPGLSPNEIKVPAGTAVRIFDRMAHVENADRTQVEDRLSWVHGQLYLHGTLLQAVSKFNEHNREKLVIEDDSLNSLNVTGLYKMHDIREFAESLQSRGVRYEVISAGGSKGTIILLATKK